LYEIYGLGHFNPSYPVEPLQGDGYLSLLVAKALGQNSLLHNSRLGAPLGLDYYDFHQPDFVHHAILRCLDLVTRKSIWVVNVYFLGSFVLITLSAFYVLRRFDLSVRVSLVAAVLYAFTPSHLYRSIYHLFLSAYYILPLGTLLALQIMLERRRGVVKESSSEQKGRFTRFLCFAIPLAILIGGSGVYYAFYSAMFLGAAACYAAFHEKNWRYGLAGFGCAALICVSTVIGLVPKDLYNLRAGTSTIVADRTVNDQYMYSLKIAQLFLPNPGHRIEKLRQIAENYDASSEWLNRNESDVSNLGFVGAFGFLMLLLWPFIRQRRDMHDEVMYCLLLLAMLGVLFATTEGFGILWAIFITEKLRAHTRIVFYLAFFALFAFAIVADKLIRRLPPRLSVQVPVTVALGLILVAGLYDESYAGIRAPLKQMQQAVMRDQGYFSTIESLAPSGGMVLQLPFVAFPDTQGPNGVAIYDDLRAYLYTQRLRWSYGSMRGRPESEYIRELSAKPVADMIRTAALAGYSGILINRKGYTDHAGVMEGELRNITHAQPIPNADDSMCFYLLTDYAAALKASMTPGDWARSVEEAKPNVIVSPISGVYSPDPTPAGYFSWCNKDGTLEILNATGTQQRADLEGTAISWTTAKTDIWFALEGHTSQVEAETSGRKFDVPLVLHPGDNLLNFHTDAARVPAPADPHEMYFRFSNLKIEWHPSAAVDIQKPAVPLH
jgi:phosphoglycerol transferase